MLILRRCVNGTILFFLRNNRCIDKNVVLIDIIVKK